MRITSGLLFLSLILLPVSTLAASSGDCAFAKIWVSVDGPLPTNGGLEEQKAHLVHVFTEDKRAFRVLSLRMNDIHAYRFILLTKDLVTENIVYNHKSDSYQITLSAPRLQYPKAKTLLRRALKQPLVSAKFCIEDGNY